MSYTITLNLPDALYARIARQAQGTRQPVEALLLNVLQTSLPSIEELPPDMVGHLQDLELMDNAALRLVLVERVPSDVQQEIEVLLDQNRSHELDAPAQSRLATLQSQADAVMLRKARAAVLLRFRGERVPTLSELRQLSEQG